MNAEEIRKQGTEMMGVLNQLMQTAASRPDANYIALATAITSPLLEIAAQLAELNAQLRAITDNEPDHVPHIRVGAEVTGDVTNHY